MNDPIERQAAIDAECEVCQIAPKKDRGHNCIYYVKGCKEVECLRDVPSAQPEPCEDAITIDWLNNYMNGMIAGSDRWWGVKWMLEDWTKWKDGS